MSTLVNKTPYEVVHDCKLNLSNIYCFGCTAYTKIDDAEKLDKWAKAGKFVGYDAESKAYHISIGLTLSMYQ